MRFDCFRIVRASPPEAGIVMLLVPRTCFTIGFYIFQIDLFYINRIYSEKIAFF
jgi:hypothetical protein